MEFVTQPTISTVVDEKPITPPVSAPAAPVETKQVEPVKAAEPVEKKPTAADIKAAIELKQKEEVEASKAPKAVEPTKPAPIVKEGEVPEQEQWFDKERGFRTREDYDKSMRAGQEKIRQQSEQLKSIEAELQAIRAKEVEKTMSPEDKARMDAIESWKNENKQAIDFIKAEVKKDIERESLVQDFEKSSKQELMDWKSKFDADPERSKLWPSMGEIYKKEVIVDQKGQPIFKGFLQNPLKYFEAVAFKEKFPEIAESIKQNAIEQYKKSMKEAAEAERNNTTALPGGPKSSGDVDVSKLSATELAKLLPRREE